MKTLKFQKKRKNTKPRQVFWSLQMMTLVQMRNQKSFMVFIPELTVELQQLQAEFMLEKRELSIQDEVVSLTREVNEPIEELKSWKKKRQDLKPGIIDEEPSRMKVNLKLRKMTMKCLMLKMMGESVEIRGIVDDFKEIIEMVKVIPDNDRWKVMMTPQITKSQKPFPK